MRNLSTTTRIIGTGAASRLAGGALCLLLGLITNTADAQHVDERLVVAERSRGVAEQAEAPVSARAAVTIRGIAQRSDGTPIEDAVIVSSAGGQAISDGYGQFTLEVDAPAVAEDLGITAVAAINGVNYTASRRVLFDPGVRMRDIEGITLQANGACEPQWIPTFGKRPGVNNWVWSMTVFDDGTGPALYVGGRFTLAGGGVSASRIVKWDGSEWSPLGGMTNYGPSAAVYALTVFDDGGGPALYAGGQFDSAGGVEANNIAKWDGTEWSPLGNGTDDPVIALQVFDDGAGASLYAGGHFVSAGGVEVDYIAKWDGDAWSPLGRGLSDPVNLNGLTVFDDGSGAALYAGGAFVEAGEDSAKFVARWDGEEWTALSNGMNSAVIALTVFDDGSGPALYAGGMFTTAGIVVANHIAKWDGTEWSSVGNGTDDWVTSLTVFDDGSGGGPALYAGGRFTLAGSTEANRSAKWDGTEWLPVGSGMTEDGSEVNVLRVFDDGSGGGPALYAGGDFTTAGGLTVDDIAQYDGDKWLPLGSGLTGSVRSLTVFDDGSGGGPALYAGGAFVGIGGVEANFIAKWDGAEWSPLGSGMSSGVSALAVFDDGSGGDPGLYAGGSFTTAGGIEVNHIAKWDGTEWSPLGSGMSDDVRALAVVDDGRDGAPALYAGGDFFSAGDAEAYRIAKWDGDAWSPVGSGMDDRVYSLRVFDESLGGGPTLYAGGDFSAAGDVEANRIAKWDGVEWSPMGSGMDDRVRALTVYDDGLGRGPALYAGGGFTSAGDVEANHIAKWDGDEWSPVGSGTDDRVRALMVFDDGSGGGQALYVGGLITLAGGLEANRIARWDGTKWSPLSSGTSSSVRALTVFDDGSGDGEALYAGGAFIVSPAGDSYLAKWQGCAGAIPGDLTGDGTVGGADLGILLSEWGACDACDDCAADLTGDCAVSGEDLGVLLSNWTE